MSKWPTRTWSVSPEDPSKDWSLIMVPPKLELGRDGTAFIWDCIFEDMCLGSIERRRYSAIVLGSRLQCEKAKLTLLLPAKFRPSRSTMKLSSSTRLRCSVHSTTQEMPTTKGLGSRINLHEIVLSHKYTNNTRVNTHLYFVRVLIKPFLYTMCVQDCPARPMILRSRMGQP